MKKFYFVLLLTGFLIGKSQTATNFNVNDCASVNHDLFTELNSGKVIVLCWVMPCPSCISMAHSASTEVQNYQSSYPNKVRFYLVDDDGLTSCSSLTGWATTNAIVTSAVFSNPLISMNDYGGPGMPKVVVIGGSSHTVFDNQNNTLNVSQFNNGIAQALVASSIGVTEISSIKSNLSIYPNPSNNDRFTISYSLNESSNVAIEIYNLLGSKVKDVLNENQSSGKHEVMVESGLKNGTYMVKITEGNQSCTSKLIINR